MSFSIYDASGPVFVRMLGNLSAVLAKAASHAEARKIDPSVFLAARLSPDMFALTRQVQIATDSAKGCVARLAGVEIPSFPDTETTFPALQERLATTIAFIDSITEAQLGGSEQRTITLKLRGQEMQWPGRVYLLNFVLPNFYFHITTAYLILRHNGVDIGKADYLGGLG